MTPLLSEYIDRIEQLWNQMPPGIKNEVRNQYVLDGWTICEHADCPPWSCRVR